jgi:hypothetical protein
LEPNHQVDEPVEADWGSKECHFRVEMTGMIALVDAVKDNGALTSLNLSSNSLGDAGIKHVADVLKSKAGLRSLNIAGNSLQDSGLVAITDALQSQLECPNANPSPYQSEKMLGMSTHICRHCGKHKQEHVNSGW